MKLNIQYFAKLREERGQSSEEIETFAKTTLDLYNELQKKYHFSLPHEILKVAVNEEFEDWQTQLKDNDTVVFIQPVAGG